MTIKKIFAERFTNIDLILIFTLFTFTFFVFVDSYNQLGFYSDDAGFLSGFKDLSIDQLFELIKSYVPGRNLHILWQYIIFSVTGTTVTDLPKLHLIQSFFDSLNVILFFIIFRFSDFPAIPIFLGSIFFAVIPSHAETHFWLSSLPMNIVSTLFLLLQTLTSVTLLSVNEEKRNGIVNSHLSFSCLVLLNLLFILCAVLTYDQVVPLCFFVALLTTTAFLRQDKKSNKKLSIIYFFISLVIVISPIFLKLLKLQGNAQEGPTFALLNFDHISSQARYAWSLTIGNAFSEYLILLSEHITNYQLLKSLLIFSIPLMTLVAVLLKGRSIYTGLIACKSISVSNSRYARRKCIYYYLFFYLISFVVYWLAYLPSLLWFISPRHCYLPSLGLSMFITISISILFDIISFVNFWAAKNAVNIILLTSVLYILFYFATLDLVEKESWIDSYQIRYNLYNSLSSISTNSVNKKVLILEDFPQRIDYGSGSLWEQEKFTAAQIVTQNKFDFKTIESNSVVSSKGYYVYVNLAKYSVDSMRYIVFDRVAHISEKDLVYFNSTNKYLQELNRLIISQRSVSDKDLSKNNLNLYKIISKSQSYNQTLIDNRQMKAACVNKDSNAINLEVNFPEIDIQEDEVLTLIAFTSLENKIIPITNVRSNGNPVLMPIQISTEAHNPPTKVVIDFYQPITNLKKFEMYATSDKHNRLLLRTDIVCSNDKK